MYQIILWLVLMSKGAFAVIYSLNETEYNRMPALFALDDYTSCMAETGGVYCVVDIDLFNTEQSDLMDMIREYSEQKIKHYNHTQIHRGVCLTTNCKKFLNETGNTTRNQEQVLERCLNQTLNENYALQGKVAEIRYCNKYNDPKNIDIYDILVAIIFLVLILMNVSGSFYDYCWRDNLKHGNPYLLAFSLRQNWKRLVAPAGRGSDPRLERLKVFHGLRNFRFGAWGLFFRLFLLHFARFSASLVVSPLARITLYDVKPTGLPLLTGSGEGHLFLMTMTMVCVVFSHTVIIIAYSYVENPLYIERSYEDPLKQILYNGSLVTHTFFVMSSFLLAYNFQIHSEKHKVTWIDWPKGILLRWLRLTPTYALILALITTWWRFFGDGPLWRLLIHSETNACRQYWWAHVLFINNYIYEDNHCMPQTWYLAADTQLFCLGLLICVAAQTPRSRKIVLFILFSLSLVIVAGHTYFQHLDAVVLQAPETYRNIYAHDDTFRILYIRGHTNISTYILGLAGGYLTYHWQNTGKNFTKYKKYRLAYWLVFPLGVAVILSGGLFYIDAVEPAIWWKVLYATFYKVFFQTLVVVFIIGVVFKIESVYRSIVEWRGFTWTGRVSYSAFLLHTFFQRGLTGIQIKPIYMSDYYILTLLAGYLFLTFIGAVALFLFVESPANGITKALMAPRPNEDPNKSTQDT